MQRKEERFCFWKLAPPPPTAAPSFSLFSHIAVPFYLTGNFFSLESKMGLDASLFSWRCACSSHCLGSSLCHLGCGCNHWRRPKTKLREPFLQYKNKYSLPETFKLPWAEDFAVSLLLGTRQKSHLPSAGKQTLGKIWAHGKEGICRVPQGKAHGKQLHSAKQKFYQVFFLFAVCLSPSTRQSFF